MLCREVFIDNSSDTNCELAEQRGIVIYSISKGSSCCISRPNSLQAWTSRRKNGILKCYIFIFKWK